MAILDAILSVLGLKSSDSKPDSRDRSTDVRVEHDPDAENEASVKGVETTSGTDEAAAAGTDATSSTGSMTEEPPEAPGAETDEVRAEPAEATDVTEHAGTDHAAVEPAEAAGPATGDPDPEDTEPAPVDGSPEANAHAASADAGETTTEGAAEAAEAAAPVGDEAAPDAESEAATEPVDTVSGIGPAYAEKLADAGVEMVGELAAADPETLAAETGISEKRLGRLVERAGERL